jgi:serine/threonine protein kinase
VRALVMELVDGPTLADRIARGAIPLEEALPIARQIAEALETAHERASTLCLRAPMTLIRSPGHVTDGWYFRAPNLMGRIH